MKTIVLLTFLGLGSATLSHSGWAGNPLADSVVEGKDKGKGQPKQATSDKLKELAEDLKSEDVLIRRQAAMALEYLGKEGLPLVQTAIKDPYGPVRAYAALALFRADPGQLEKVLSLLSDTLDDKLVGSRLDSVRILGEIGATAKKMQFRPFAKR